MQKIIKSPYQINFKFDINKIKSDKQLATLFYELDIQSNKFFIQYYSNSLMGNRININNIIHIPILDDKKKLSIRIQSLNNKLSVTINRKQVYSTIYSNRSTTKLILIGRPFFGKTLATFFQYFKQSAIKFIDEVSIEKTVKKTNVNKKILYKNMLDEYEVKTSSANLVNVLDKANYIDYEILNRFGEYHKLTARFLENYLDKLMIQNITYLLSENYKDNDNKKIDINNEFDDVINDFQLLDPKGREYYLGRLYLNYVEGLIDNIDFKELINIILSDDEFSPIPLYVAGHIYLGSNEFGPMIRIIKKINNQSINHELIENYYIMLYSISQNKQVDFFSDAMEKLIHEVREKNNIYFGALVSMQDILFRSYHYSNRGFKFKKSIDALTFAVKDWDGLIYDDYLNFSLGVLNTISQRPKLASHYLRKIKNKIKESSNYLVSALEHCGEIEEARAILFDCIISTGRHQPYDELVSHYTVVDNWLNRSKKFLFKSYSDKSSEASYRKIEVHKGLNFETIDNCYIADHDFSFKFRFEYFEKIDLTILNFSKALNLGIFGKYLILKLNIGSLNTDILIDILKTGLMEIELSRELGEIKLSLNGVQKSIEIAHDEIIYGGRIVLFANNITELLHSLTVYDYKEKIKSNNVVIYSSWYGDEFTELFFNSLVPSLKRPDGIPEILRKYKVIWKIYTSEEQYLKIKNRISDIDYLADSIEINKEILKSESFEPREYLHETFIDCIKKSKDDNDIILFAPPDHIFGGGLATLINESNIDSYIICPHPRISYEAAYLNSKHKELIFKNENNGICNYINNRELARIALLKYPHQIVEYGFNPTSTDGVLEASYWWSAKMNGTNVEVRFKEPPPVLLYARGDIIAGMLSEGYSSTFERVDHDLVEWMDKSGKLVVNSDNLKFFWVEYCKDTRNIPTIGNGYWPFSAQKIYSTPHIWSI